VASQRRWTACSRPTDDRRRGGRRQNTVGGRYLWGVTRHMSFLFLFAPAPAPVPAIALSAECAFPLPCVCGGEGFEWLLWRELIAVGGAVSAHVPPACYSYPARGGRDGCGSPRGAVALRVSRESGEREGTAIYREDYLRPTPTTTTMSDYDRDRECGDRGAGSAGATRDALIVPLVMRVCVCMCAPGCIYMYIIVYTQRRRIRIRTVGVGVAVAVAVFDCLCLCVCALLACSLKAPCNPCQ